MSRLETTRQQKQRRTIRVRALVKGTTERPRLSVKISNLHISAQIIDDQAHKTLVFSTTAGQKSVTGSMTDKATWVGSDIAKKAKKARIERVAFDRGPKLYHGRIKALADAARKEGLEF